MRRFDIAWTLEVLEVDEFARPVQKWEGKTFHFKIEADGPFNAIGKTTLTSPGETKPLSEVLIK